MLAMRIVLSSLLVLTALQVAIAQGPYLRLPKRPIDAVGGSEFAKEIAGLAQPEREERIWREVVSGNVPGFLRQLAPVPVTANVESRTVTGRIYVTPDYLAVGSDNDYLFVPLSPYTAQRIADRVRCMLPTPKMVDEVYQAAAVKLAPSPIPPSPAMTTVPVFLDHNRIVHDQRSPLLAQFPLGALVAGDKKDIVICKALPDKPDRVAIYGWHRLDGKPIQPLYLGHFAYWADYSHGTRLVDPTMEVEGHWTAIDRVLADPKLSVLVSSEGPLRVSRYRFSSFPRPAESTGGAARLRCRAARRKDPARPERPTCFSPGQRPGSNRE